MNQTTPPPLDAPSPPKTSTLAIWSLVLGAISLTCLSFFSIIPGIICGHKAISGIARSRGALTGNGMAIAGLVMSYVGIFFMIFWLGFWAAIIIPNFVKARETSTRNACINNLRQIDAAKNEWALENNKKEGTPTAQDISPYIKGGFESLHCPLDGTYTIGSLNEPPTCSVTGHRLLRD